MSRRVVTALPLAAALLVGACSDTVSLPTSALSMPVDFTYACEGANRTVAPEDDQSAKDANKTRMCADFTQKLAGSSAKTVQGDLIGVAINQSPPGAVVLQLNPASGSRAIIDADSFVPGFTAIPVGDTPIRVLRHSDWSAFYVLSAGDQSVTKIVIRGLAGRLERCAGPSADPELTPSCYETSAFDLPGVPGDAAAIVDGRLFVAAAYEPELWVFDLATDPPAPDRVGLPGVLQTLQPVAGGFVATWVDRPVVTLLDGDGAPVVGAEAGIVAECADGIDNDGDGFVDQGDPDCDHAADKTEAGTRELDPPAAQTEPAASFDGVSLCEDGLDNDGDGFTDAADPACAGDPDGEGLPECGDGLDNDGDGATDTDDPSCYHADGPSEGHFGPFGPFHAAVVEGGDAGTFVYVLDQREARVAVFDVDPAAGTLSRVNVWAQETQSPAIPYRTYANDTSPVTVEELVAVRAAPRPALVFQHESDLLLSGANLLSLTATPVTGELWTRYFAPADGEARAAIAGGLGSSSYKPVGCDPDVLDRCVQPERDADTHYVFGPSLDGKVQPIQAVLRGVPRHRLAEKTLNPGKRGHDVGKADLWVQGKRVTTGDGIKRGYPFLGARGSSDELQAEVEDEQPQLFRRDGVWPPEDLEQMPRQEQWYLTYEGQLPGAAGRLGRLVTDTTFYAPRERFCESGVEVGDWLVLSVAPDALSEALRAPIAIEADGTPCAAKAVDAMQVQARVSAVGMDTLEVDPATAEVVLVLPELDETALREEGSKRLAACRDAREELRKWLALDPDRPEAAPLDLAAYALAAGAWTPANLPARVTYTVRAAEVWTVVGSRSGYLHRWTWNTTEQRCEEDASMDARHAGRLAERAEAGPKYEQCPPSTQVATAALLGDDPIVDPAGRFANFSFQLDMFPACDEADDGAITLPGTVRDTLWTFAVTGPHQPITVSPQVPGLATRLPRFESRRQLFYVDTAANRLSVFNFLAASNAASFSPTFE